MNKEDNKKSAGTKKTTTKKITTTKKVTPKKTTTKTTIKKETKKESKIKKLKQTKYITNELFIICSLLILGLLIYISNKEIEEKYNTEYTYKAEEIKFKKGNFSFVGEVSNNYYFVTQDDKQLYLYDYNLNQIGNGYESIENAFAVNNKVFFLVSKNNKLGLVDDKGKQLFDYKYQDIYSPNDLDDVIYFIVVNDSTYEIATIKNNKITKTNKYQIYGFKYADGQTSQDCKLGYCPVIVDNKLKYVDYNGKYINTKKYNDNVIEDQTISCPETVINNLIIDVDKEPYFTVIEDGKLGIIDKNGKTIIKPKYYEIRYSDLYKGFVVISGKETLVINKNGKTIKDLSKYLDYSDNEIRYSRSIAQNEDIDSSKGIKIYDNIKDKYYYFNKDMKLINTDKNAIYYGENYYLVKNKDRYAIYDYNNKVIIDNVLSINVIQDNKKLYHVVCVDENKCNIYNLDWKPILDSYYKKIESVKNGYIYINNDNEYLIYNMDDKKLETIKKGQTGHIGYMLNNLEEDNIILSVYDSNDSSLFEGLSPKSIILIQNGKKVKEYNGNIGNIYKINNNTMFTSSGIYDKNGNKKKLNIDINKESFNWAHYDSFKGRAFYEIYSIKEDGLSYSTKVYRIIKVEKK